MMRLTHGPQSIAELDLEVRLLFSMCVINIPKLFFIEINFNFIFLPF